MLPNPLRDLLWKRVESTPEVAAFFLVAKALLVLALVYVLHKYYTKNKLALAAVALVAAYFFFA